MVESTFVYAEVSEKAADSADDCMRRPIFPLSKVGDWADLVSDSDEEDVPSVLSTVTLSSFSINVSEKTPPTPQSVPEQASKPERTPLRFKASAFVPLNPLCSTASACVPQSSQTVGEYPDSTAPDDPWGASTEPCTPTSVMLRNLPCGFTRKELIRIMDSKGLRGVYDFVYVPMDFSSKMCLGYAFVNLNDGEQVQSFINKFNGRRHWPRRWSLKVCHATLSRTQGLEANIDRFRNSPLMSSEVPECFKPAFFVGSQQAPFPDPTRELPPVYLRSPPLQ